MTAPGFTGENILIVDDRSENLKLLKEMLNKAGYSARPHLNGEAALKAIENSPPDLVLLDIMMPGLSGYEVCERLRSDARARDIPVIFLSALNDEEAIARGFAAGGVDYITKPFRAEEVLARVQTHLNLRRASRQIIEQDLRLQREMADRHKFEIALHDSEEQFRCMFELHSAVMLLVDPETATIVNANHAAIRFYGYALKDFLGMSIHRINLLTPEEILQHLRDAREKGRNRFEFRHRLADGRIRDVEVRSTPVPFRSRLLLFSIISDITERKRAEDALLEAKAAAESHSRAKSEFLANMSHEIRTPMNSVLGFLSIVLDDANLSKKHRRFLDTAHKASKSLLVLINDILDIGKLETGRMELDSVSFDLRGLIRETLSALRILATEKGLSMDSRIDDAPPRFIGGDPQRIKKILIHLVGNAIKFTDKGGVDIIVKPGDDKRFLHFTIRDTGIGMSEDCLAKIFQPFMQADASASRRFGGVGLGTAISKQLAELMGGAIWAESEVGKGSAFHFTIPLNRAIAASESERDDARPGPMPAPAPGKSMAPSDARPADDEADGDADMDLDTERLRDVFRDLLISFKEYSPDAAEPFLDQLSLILGYGKTDSIRQTIDRFNFSDARRSTLKLARDMGIDMENYNQN